MTTPATNQSHGAEEALRLELQREVAERKRLEEALRRTEQLYQRAIMGTGAVPYIYDFKSGTYSFMGEGITNLTGYPAHEINRKLWCQIIQESVMQGEAAGQTKEEASRRTLSGELRTWWCDMRIVTRDGQRRWLSDTSVLNVNEQGQPVGSAGILQDITERKKLEGQLLRAQRMESLGTLASGIAHDLNNILAPITIATQILRLKKQDEETEQLLARIESSAQRGADVVRQVLTFARGIEGERAMLQPRHLVRDVLKIIKETFPRSINITSRLAEDLWPVIGDATQLHQVLLNLCLNARDAMPGGGNLQLTGDNLMLDEATAQGQGCKAGPWVMLQVKDTGIGIDPGILDKIFEPFFTTKEFGKGTGLGLSTALGIAKSHGGQVRVYSEVGQGSIFKIFLPATPNAEAKGTQLPAEGLPLGRGELILVVDDEPGIREVTRQTLLKHGYRVATAGDGAEAMAFARQSEAIQLLVTDIMMPRMEGLALIRAIRKLDPKIKIIASSGMTMAAGQTDRAAELKALNVGEFLEKPYTADKLLLAIGRALELKAGETPKAQ